MKKLVLLLAIVLPMAVLAQKSPVDKLFEKYANQKGFTTVNVSGKLLQFAGQIDTGDENISEMVSNLSGIRVLTCEDHEINSGIDFYEELEKDGFFKNNDYEVLMEVTEDDEIVRFLARDAGDNRFSEILLIVGGDENALISITGLIDPKNIGKLTRSLDIGGVGDLDIDID